MRSTKEGFSSMKAGAKTKGRTVAPSTAKGAVRARSDTTAATAGRSGAGVASRKSSSGKGGSHK